MILFEIQIRIEFNRVNKDHRIYFLVHGKNYDPSFEYVLNG
jgi:hypothetical protein